MNSDTLLQTHAEVAIALAGFASVVAALRRPLSPFARQRFLSLLALSLIQVLGCLLPLWWIDLAESTPAGWRILSILLLALNAARLWWLVVLPNRRMSPEERTILNPLMHRITWGIGWLSLVCLLSNSVGIPFSPNFDLYYTGLLATLCVGFTLFADVATDGS